MLGMTQQTSFDLFIQQSFRGVSSFYRDKKSDLFVCFGLSIIHMDTKTLEEIEFKSQSE